MKAHEDGLGSVDVAATLTVREARPTDWKGIWPFLEQIIRAGETYTWPRDDQLKEALALAAAAAFRVLWLSNDRRHRGHRQAAPQ